MTNRRLITALAVPAIAVASLLGGCSSEADTASRNLSAEADDFKVQRRVVFFNGVTDKYLLVMEGRCSKGNEDSPGTLTITCKTSPTKYKKHYLGLSQNVSYLIEQTDEVEVDPYHYKLSLRPESVAPDIDLKTSIDR